MGKRLAKNAKVWIRTILLTWCTIALIFLQAHPVTAQKTHYEITSSAPFNQPQSYPAAQSLSPKLYRPVSQWMGRLILPTDQSKPSAQDWVWMEVLHAPDEALVGKQVRLEWKPTPEVNQYLAAVTRDLTLAPEVAESQRKGNLHPTRLNQRSQVGPLQSIAGARPKDDVIVALKQAAFDASRNSLQIEAEPILETGRFYALVKILAPVTPSDPAFIPSDCPGSPPCSSELFRVQHYNPATQQFNGTQEIIRIPQQPRDRIGVFASTPRQLEKSPVGELGWYIYGAQDRTGRFVVQSLKPRSLFQLKPQQTISTQKEAFNYIYTQNWKNTEQLAGTLKTTLVDLQPSRSEWQEGDRALVMHIFGGRGGKSGEAPMFGTVPGHFSYGMAEVVRDPFTQELQLEVHYQQVYGTNIEGIISGTHSWANYMGNMQWGWLGTRPVNDVLVKLDLITKDYDFGGIKLSPFTELIHQLQIVTARYRIGDGTGAAMITPATSCVQDSNQALFLTIQSLRQQVESNPAIQQWWSSNPQHPTIQRFEKLIALGDDLQRQLTPLGIVRKDWKQNATVLAGTEGDFTSANRGQENVFAAIASWRTILPKQAQDELSFLFLQYGAKLWFLRTNQVGGINPDIYPIAPTSIFARWLIPGTDIPIFSILFLRLLSAFRVPSFWDWLTTVGLLSLYGAIAVGLLGRPALFRQRRLSLQAVWTGIRRLFFPAFVEELVFRVLLIPYPSPSVTWFAWGSWAFLSLGLFLVYRFFRLKKSQTPKKSMAKRLALATGLGIVCTLTFLFTRSIATIILIHWSLTLAYGDRFTRSSKTDP